MNDHPSQDGFDARMQQLHVQSLSAMSQPTLTRLRAARADAHRSPRRLPTWLLATACSTLLAVGFGLQLHRTGEISPSPLQQTPSTATASDDDTFDQNPDLYVWLGSDNALAME
jgi:type VI protein secretion system component VasF